MSVLELRGGSVVVIDDKGRAERIGDRRFWLRTVGDGSDRRGRTERDVKLELRIL